MFFFVLFLFYFRKQKCGSDETDGRRVLAARKGERAKSAKQVGEESQPLRQSDEDDAGAAEAGVERILSGESQNSWNFRMSYGHTMPNFSEEGDSKKDVLSNKEFDMMKRFDDEVPPLSFFEMISSNDSPYEKLLFSWGIIFATGASATLPLTCWIWGDLVDSIAGNPDVIEEKTNNVLKVLLVIAGAAAGVFFGAYFCFSLLAPRVADGYRRRLARSVMYQDHGFFDAEKRVDETDAEAGFKTLFETCAWRIEDGITEFLEAFVAIGSFLFAFGFSFYFGWELTIYLLPFAPLLMFTAWGIWYNSVDKEEEAKDYSECDKASSEAIKNYKTIMSLNAQAGYAKLFSENVVEVARKTTARTKWLAFFHGLQTFILYLMYAVAFFISTRLIIDTTQTAIDEHPPPFDFAADQTGTANQEHSEAIYDWCGLWYDPGTQAYDICGCSIPWQYYGLSQLNCGCGFGVSENQLTVSSTCFSGGRALLIFFALFYGCIGLSSFGETLVAVLGARKAALMINKIIYRKPDFAGTSADIAAACFLREINGDGSGISKNDTGSTDNSDQNSYTVIDHFQLAPELYTHESANAYGKANGCIRFTKVGGAVQITYGTWKWKAGALPPLSFPFFAPLRS